MEYGQFCKVYFQLKEQYQKSPQSTLSKLSYIGWTSHTQDLGCCLLEPQHQLLSQSSGLDGEVTEPLDLQVHLVSGQLHEGQHTHE